MLTPPHWVRASVFGRISITVFLAVATSSACSQAVCDRGSAILATGISADSLALAGLSPAQIQAIVDTVEGSSELLAWQSAVESSSQAIQALTLAEKAVQGGRDPQDDDVTLDQAKADVDAANAALELAVSSLKTLVLSSLTHETRADLESIVQRIADGVPLKYALLDLSQEDILLISMSTKAIATGNAPQWAHDAINSYSGSYDVSEAHARLAAVSQVAHEILTCSN